MQSPPASQRPFVFSDPPDRSVGKCFWQAVLDTLIATALGALATIPLVLFIIPLSGVRHLSELFPSDLFATGETTRVYKCSSVPKDDLKLFLWAQAQPGWSNVRVDRAGKTVRLHYHEKGDAPEPPPAPMHSLGYKVLGSALIQPPMASDPNKIMELMGHSPAMAGLLISSALGTEIGFIAWVFYCRKRARDACESLPRFFRGSTGKSFFIGLWAGLLMVGLGQVYGVALEAVLGHGALVDGPMVVVRGFPLWGKITMALAGTFCAPVAEELFFRGTLFGSFAAAGHVKQGILVSALAFAAVHMDVYNFVILFVMGAVLAYIYHKTGSLAACMTAHAVNNGIAFLMLFTHHG